MKSQISTKQDQNQTLEVDFGNRKVASQNFSKLVSLPKEALSSCGCNLKGNITLGVKLVQKDGEKYIKLTPVSQQENQ